MKKIFALILAIVMMASMSVVVFAGESSVEVNNSQTGTGEDAGLLPGGTVLTYGVAEAYTVVIPADQTFAKNNAQGATEAQAFIATAQISASGVKVAGNEKFVVSIDSANNWALKDANRASSDVAYTAYATVGETTTQLTDEGKIFDVASTTAVAGGTGSAALTFYTAGTGQEGNYVDTLTFIVSMEAVQA